MLRSMTGFGASSSEETDLGSLRVEIRSVNHRHLTVKTRVPDELAAFEADIERSVRSALERGAVSVTVSSRGGERGGPLRIDAGAATRYRDQLQELARSLGIEARLSLEMLLQLPGVLDSPADGADDDATRHRVIALVEAALERLSAMRIEEGRSIEADLKRHALATEKLVGKIERAMPRVVRKHQKDLMRRVSELLGRKTEVGEAEFAREVALLADRLDVSEEIARLKSHLAQLAKSLAQGTSVGRQLDFLVQELFREVNTIGSKCSDAQVAHWVVEAKTEVERLREQVQNVE
jgi:uncharacterized protein (TIGR00255 family)